MADVRLEIPPCPPAAVDALQRTLGIARPVAEVLVRRGLADPAAAGAWLRAEDAHDPAAFAGIDAAVASVLRHVGAGDRITVHGDYDVDGVCATAILVATLRDLGAVVDWFLPSRADDGYGLSAATVARLAERGTRLLVTVDCAVTAVEEVAAARAAGIDVVVTDHHTPRADGALPDAPVVHPALCGYPCPDLCAAGVAYKLAGALLAAAGRDPSAADVHLDLVALATVADCVPLVGENRRLVRAGLRALAGTRRPGLRALMRIAKVDPGAVDARAVGFRLAPRINAAGRLAHADVGLELVLTEDEARAEALADELDHANAERRHVEERIRFAAEAQVAELGEQPAYVLWGEDWHAGVIGIVASRIAERHHRPTVLIALDGDEGTGSGRSIPGFDLLGGLDAAAGHLLRHGGHRAAAGCTIARGDLDAFRAAFVAHAAATLRPEDLVPTERVDAVVAGDELGLALAEELAALAPFGTGNPEVSLLVPAARLTDPRPMGEGRHVRFTVESGGARARAVAFGVAALPDGELHDATFGLELNEWGGVVEPRLVLRRTCPPEPGPVALVGEPSGPEDALAAALEEEVQPFGAPAPPTAPAVGGRVLRDRRGGGVAGTIASLVAGGEPVLVVCADAPARLRAFAGRVGGFSLTSWTAVERDASVLAADAHVVAVDPPPHPSLGGLLRAGAPAWTAVLAWGEEELRFASDVHAAHHDLRDPLTRTYRALRDGQPPCEALPRHPLVAGRVLRVLRELGLADVGAGGRDVRLVPPAGRTDLERSPTFRACRRRLEEGSAWLSSRARRAA